MKRLNKFLAGLLTALLISVTAVVPVTAISDAGRPELTRLWTTTDDGNRFTCTASYVFPYISDYGSWIVSAGHCATADIVARNQAAGIRGVVNWRAVLSSHGEYGTATVDLALGTVPETRNGEKKKLWLADKAPTDPSRVYIHGFPEGVEYVTTGVLVPAGYEQYISFLVQDEQGPILIRKTVTELYPGTRLVLVKHDRVMGGSSGSPILDGNDRLVGILWGGVTYDDRREIEGVPDQFQGWDLVFMTPVEEIHKLFKSIGVDG